MIIRNNPHMVCLIKERDALIDSLKNYDIPDTEKRFIVRRISIITERMLSDAPVISYTEDTNEDT